MKGFMCEEIRFGRRLEETISVTVFFFIIFYLFLPPRTPGLGDPGWKLHVQAIFDKMGPACPSLLHFHSG